MQQTKKNGVLFAVLVLFAINILNFYDRHVPGALVEPMRKEFHLSDMQIGLLGSAFIWLYAIMGVPLGRIADSGSRKKLLAWGLVVWASLTACAAKSVPGGPSHASAAATHAAAAADSTASRKRGWRTVMVLE